MLLFGVNIVVFILVAGEILHAKGQDNSFVLDDKSFNIKSQVNEAGVWLAIKVDEHYSVGQHRARLQYATSKFIYDARSGVSLLANNGGTGWCHEKSVERMNNDLYGDKYAPTLMELFRLVDKKYGHNYVIGPAKLLFLVAHERANVKLDQEETVGMENIRNHAIVRYGLDVQLDEGQQVTLMMFYDKHNHSPDSLLGDIPLRLVIYIPDSGQLIIDYFNYQLTDDQVRSAESAGPIELGQDSTDVILDLFALPTSVNCTRFVDKTHQLSLFQAYSFGSSRVSFRADSEWYEDRLQHFVAFDGLLQFMRIDLKHQQTRLNKLDTSKIYDYRSNRLYTMPTNSDSVSHLDQLNGKSGRNCMITYISSPNQSMTRQSFPLDSFLFGAVNFQPMGRALVHGIEAQVYEAFSTQIPAWLVESLPFRTERGEFDQRITGHQLRQYSNGTMLESQLQFNVLVYLADDTLDGPRLLRLELYDLTVSHRRLIFVAKINNFAWELSDAPTGDSARDLFSVLDRCLEGTKHDRYLEIELVLEEDNRPENFTRPEAQNWIKQWWLRDTALAAGLSETLGIKASMMYDLESRLIESNSRSSIGLSFRVTDLPQRFVDIIYLGNAEVIGVTPKSVKLFAPTLTDCLWANNDLARPTTHLIWSETYKECLIDGDLNITNRDSSKVLSLKSYGNAEVFRVEQKEDNNYCLARKWLHGDDFSHFENWIMVLQDVRMVNSIQQQPSESSDVRVRIRRAKIKNFDRAGGRLDAEAKETSMVFSGFGFDDDDTSGSLVSRAEDVSGVAIRSLQRCQAACLMDLTCRSYSFCATYPEPRCILSYVTIGGARTRDYLSSKEVRQATKGSHLGVESLEGPEVGLVRDHRCELRNKAFIDLFQPSYDLKLPLRGFDITPTKSIEQCAELCMAQSLEIIKSSASLNQELNKLLMKDGSTELEALRLQHRQAMARFCNYFLYLDSSLDEKRRKLLERRVNVTAGSEYCLIEAPDHGQAASEDNNNLLFDFSAFKFDYTNLYERVANLRLVNSELTPEESEAYRAVSELMRKSTSDGQYRVLRESLKRGKNFQAEFRGDPHSCGHLCFTQTSGLWPACRSFDVIVKEGQFVSSTCLLNTGSMRRYMAEPPIDLSNNTKVMQAWHYEPIFGQLSELVDTEFALDYLGNTRRPTTGGSYSRLLLGAILLVGLASGLVMGGFASARLEALYAEGRWGSSDDRPARGLIMRDTCLDSFE